MKNIITIQLTQAMHHTNGMVGSWSDWELTDLGKAQADRIGIRLRDEMSDRSFTLYSSDLTRAKQMSKIIGKHLKAKPIYRKELRGRNLGSCCGKSIKWMYENMEVFEKTIDDKMLPDVESRRDQWVRLSPFFNEIISNSQENTVIISHGDLLGMFNAMFLGLDVESLNRVEMSGLSGGVTEMFINDNGKRFINKMADMSYV